jgi:hypothetical protein
VSADLKETKELVLYPDKNALVRDLLDEAWKQVRPMLGSDHQGTNKLRLLEVLSYKIHSVQVNNLVGGKFDCSLFSAHLTFWDRVHEEFFVFVDAMIRQTLNG